MAALLSSLDFKRIVSPLFTLFIFGLSIGNLNAQALPSLLSTNNNEECMELFPVPSLEESADPSKWSLFGGQVSCASNMSVQKRFANSSIDVRTPVDEIYKRLEWPDPRVNFMPGGIGTPVGDLTGNGFTDLIRVYNATIDERPNATEFFSAKTLIFEGGTSEPTVPDYILYDGVVPVGDINGSGKTNLVSRPSYFSLNPPKLYEFTGSRFSEISITDNSDLSIRNLRNSDIISDLDDDGYVDWVLNDEQILFGSDQYSSFQLKEYDIFNLLEGSPSTYNFNNTIVLDDFKYIILSFSVSNFQDPIREPGSYLAVLKITEERELEMVQEIKISSLSRMVNAKFFPATVSGDNNPSLIYYNRYESMQSDNPTGYHTFRIPPSKEPDQLFENEKVPFYSNLLWPAGNLRGNGSTDFIVRNGDDDLLYHSEFDVDSGELKLGAKLPYQEPDRAIFMPASIPTESSKVASFGDQSGNGRDDFYLSMSNPLPVEIDGDPSFGQLRVYADDAGEFAYEPLVYPLKDYQRTIVENIFPVGDVTGNGIEDFVIHYLQTQNFRPEIALHEGGANWKEPYFVWALDKNRILDDLTAGFFTSLSRRDLVLLTKAKNPPDGKPQSRIEITEGGSNLTNDFYFSIDFDDYLENKPWNTPQVYQFGMVENAGDVNNSGFDDLLISTPLLNLPPGLYFGNEQLSGNGPNLFLDFEDGYLSPNDSRGNYVGMSLKGLGDVSGDGIDDFAYSDIEASFYESVRELGAVHVYYGKDDIEPDFSVPDLTLRSDTSALRGGDNFYWFGYSEIATGNFRNNKNADIVVKSAFHFNNNSREGIAGVHVYHQEETEGQPQQRLPLHTNLLETSLTENSDNPFLSDMSGARMAGIPDIDNDGHDELLLMSTFPYKDAVLHRGGEQFSETPDIHFSMPDGVFTVSASVQNGFNQPRTPVGDFTGDGTTNLIMGQNDFSLRDYPIYMFEIKNISVSNEPLREEPVDLSLGQNFPNPFNPSTVIKYSLAEATHVTMEVFDMLGRRVAILQDGVMNAGTHRVTFNAGTLASGIYLYRLSTDNMTEVRQMVLVK